jgi:hypothetical protein
MARRRSPILNGLAAALLVTERPGRSEAGVNDGWPKLTHSRESFRFLYVLTDRTGDGQLLRLEPIGTP